MVGASPPWTLEELTDFIGVDLARAKPDKPKEASALEGAHPPPRPDPKPRPTLTPSYICSNCKAIGKHLGIDCPIKCGDCGMNFCPGARHELCAVACDTPPSQRDLKNALGKDMFPTLVAKLDKLWQAKHPGKSISVLEQEVSSLEAEECPFGLVHSA